MTALLLAVALAGQDPADPASDRRARPVRVRSDVRIIIEETPREEFEHDYYHQPSPVEYRSGGSTLSSAVWYRTVCRPQEENPTPIFLPPAAPPPSIPLTISATFSQPHLSVNSSLNFSLITGSARTDPIITKPALFGGGSPGGSTSSDAPFLAGPDVDLLLVSDVAAGTSLHVFARALFGSFEVFDTPASLQLYGVGPRLSVPILTVGGLELAFTVAAGPAFLRTSIGDAAGFDGGIGLRAEHSFTAAFSFVAALEANLYFSQNVTAFGPVVNLGFNLSW